VGVFSFVGGGFWRIYRGEEVSPVPQKPPPNKDPPVSKAPFTPIFSPRGVKTPPLKPLKFWDLGRLKKGAPRFPWERRLPIF